MKTKIILLLCTHIFCISWLVCQDNGTDDESIDGSDLIIRRLY